MTYRPRLLDLFARAQGTSVGYARAGFEVCASDIDTYDKHPEVSEFLTADAMEILSEVDFCRTFDAITASPVCKGYSSLAARHDREYAMLIAPVIERLEIIGRPYVIENVESSLVYSEYGPGPVVRLCGSMFGLGATCLDGQRRQLRRHRLFKPGGWTFAAPGPCAHARLTGGVYGTGGGGQQLRGYRFSATGNTSEAARAMGIDWMDRFDLCQAIPPAYAEYIGRALMQHIERTS